MRQIVSIINVVVIALLAAGCNGKAVSQYASRKVITDPDTGRVLYDRTVHTGATQELPPNASGPTTQRVDESGVNSTLAGTREETPEQIIAHNGKTLYLIGGGFALLAVLAVAVPMFRSVPLAIAAGVAAAACFATPTFLNVVGPWPLLIASLVILAAIVWYVAKRHASARSSVIGGALAAEANAKANQGDLISAVDTFRSAVAALAANKKDFARAAGISASAKLRA
jgi:hypothetical protein